MNALLLLPADALAVLPCRLRVWDPNARLGGKEGEGDSGRDANVDEEAIVRALDDRFEYAKRKGDPAADDAEADGPRDVHLRGGVVRGGGAPAVLLSRGEAGRGNARGAKLA